MSITPDWVQLQDVSVTFRSSDGAGQRRVLDRLRLTIGRGEFVCVVGPSGCGKTTLLNCIAGFQPYSGTILLGDQAVSGPGRERGVMFQDYGLFPWFTVEENVALGPRINGKNREERIRLARHFIRLVGLEGYEREYPNRLSGGMKQRVGLARVLANEPALLLMDEPFAALDEETRHTLQTELLHIWQETRFTCLLVTHSISEAVYLADRVLVLLPDPNRIALDLPIGLSKLRDRGDERLFQYEKLVRSALKGEPA